MTDSEDRYIDSGERHNARFSAAFPPSRLAFYDGKVPGFTYSSLREYKPAFYFSFCRFFIVNNLFKPNHRYRIIYSLRLENGVTMTPKRLAQRYSLEELVILCYYVNLLRLFKPNHRYRIIYSIKSSIRKSVGRGLFLCHLYRKFE